ncbi:protein TolQ [Thermodesulforhabdus norvegica]|uniref:Cell division and transport-associated protein TolQ n=1 Tax=Thermodesulforhabdus norvegica TaxID=39841 RepID=A0A1I4TEL6_9BACT|nr:protein TolQ [Thermodesulforhabdus norvegica]SFM75146.1 Cell division and transport-associated protein TolQ [Thermodesulforhabdus norvegica]
MFCFGGFFLISSVLPSTNGSGIFELLGHTGILVRIVLLILIVMSVCCWGIIIAKFIRFRRVRKETISFILRFHQQKNLSVFYREASAFSETPLVHVFRAGYGELVRAIRGKEGEKLRPEAGELVRDSIFRTMHTALLIERGRLEKWLGLLASTGSSAPFIGLFGTVWGIMNSFRNIGLQGSANLAVVAPGIAEALIATAVGLATAIPAVIFYNYFSQKIRAVEIETRHFISDFMNFVDRDLMRRIASSPQGEEVHGIVTAGETGRAVL